jgi:hypothetical protein
MDDPTILHHISALVEEEHRLRSHPGVHTEEDRARLAHLGVELDQCWDLLRQRRAKEEFGQDPDVAEVRSESTVEHYRQ